MRGMAAHYVTWKSPHQVYFDVKILYWNSHTKPNSFILENIERVILDFERMKQYETFEKKNKFLKHFTAADQYFLCKTLHAQNYSLIHTVPDIFLNIQFLASINFTSIGTSIKTWTQEFTSYINIWKLVMSQKVSFFFLFVAYYWNFFYICFFDFIFFKISCMVFENFRLTSLVPQQSCKHNRNKNPVFSGYK